MVLKDQWSFLFWMETDNNKYYIYRERERVREIEKKIEEGLLNSFHLCVKSGFFWRAMTCDLKCVPPVEEVWKNNFEGVKVPPFPPTLSPGVLDWRSLIAARRKTSEMSRSFLRTKLDYTKGCPYNIVKFIKYTFSSFANQMLFKLNWKKYSKLFFKNNVL